jgi:hypothetical protein
VAASTARKSEISSFFMAPSFGQKFVRTHLFIIH